MRNLRLFKLRIALPTNVHTNKNLRAAIVMGSVFSLVASLFLGSGSVATAQLSTHMTLQKAKVYDIDWQKDGEIAEVSGMITPELVITSVNATTLEGRIISKGHTLYNYNDESRVIATFGYDQTGKKSSDPVWSIPVYGVFAIQIPDGYDNADYVRLQINSNSFLLTPTEPSNYTTIETTPLVNETNTATATTADNRNAAITTDRLSTLTTTTSVVTNDTSILTVTLANKTSIVTNTTVTELPDDEDYIAPQDGENSSTASTSSWSGNSTDYSSTKTTVTKLNRVVTNQTHIIDTAIETTIAITDSMTTEESALVEGHTSVWNHDSQAFKINTYHLIQGWFEEIEIYQGFIPVSLQGIITVHRLGGLNEGG
jgi:hypothetical protein